VSLNKDNVMLFSIYTLICIILLPPIILTPYLIPTPEISIQEIGSVEESIAPGHYFSDSEWNEPSRLYILNDTPIMEKDWYIGTTYGAENSTLHRSIDVILSNFTRLVCEVTFYVKNGPCVVGLQIFNDQEVSDNVESDAEAMLSIEIPVVNYVHYTWTYYIGLYTSSSFFGNVEVRSFKMWAQSAVSLFPVRVDLTRTNGEDIQSHPTDWEFRPKLDFREFNNSGFNHEYRIWSSSETIYLSPGNYSGSFRWGITIPFNLTVNESHSTNWTIVLDVVQIEFAFSPRIISYALRTEINYKRVSPFDDAIMYYPANQQIGFSLTGGGSYIDVPHDEFGYHIARFNLNSTTNVLVSVDFKLLQLGALAFSERGVLLSLVLILILILPAFLRILRPLYSNRKELVRDKRFIPLALYTLGLLSPWAHASLPEANQSSLVYLADFRGLALRLWWTDDSSLLLIHSRYLDLEVWITAFAWLFAFSMLYRISSRPSESRDSLFLILLVGPIIYQSIYLVHLELTTALIQVLPSLGLFLTGIAVVFYMVHLLRYSNSSLKGT